MTVNLETVNLDQSECRKINSHLEICTNQQLVAEGEVITSVYLLSRKRSDYRLVITEPEVTNCFSINFQAFTNNSQHNFIKKQKVNLDQPERRKINRHLEIYTNGI